MYNYRRLLFFCLLFVLLLALTLLFNNTAYVQTTSGVVYPAPPGSVLPRRGNSAALTNTDAHLAGAGAQVLPLADHPLPAPVPPLSTNSLQDEEVCYQLLANPQLDVVEEAGFGTADPWVFYTSIVYFSNQDWVSPNHSLLFQDADTAFEDPTPFVDALAQAIAIPANLTTVTVDYQRATTNRNRVDKAFGGFYTIDDQGFLDELQVFWQVSDTNGNWAPEQVLITDPSLLELLDGKELAFVLQSDTDNSSPAEIIWFDDVTVTACAIVEPSISMAYLPIMLKELTTGPICRPPTENPADDRTQNRGTVQTGAICQTTLSSLDRRDYYTLIPSQSGNHTFHLRKMPSWSNWTLSLFFDNVDSFPPVPGPTGGHCRIGTPGPGDKSVTCSLQAGQKYLLLVAAGDEYDDPLGSYEMQVTRP
ncbi:MAG TPA: hypothetical protein VF177_22890 [Anaerolineae bacterium]